MSKKTVEFNVVIQLPPETYQELVNLSQETGKSIEKLLKEKLTVVVVEQPKIEITLSFKSD